MSSVSDSTPRVFRSLEEALANPRHGKSKDGTVNEWSVWRIAGPTGEEYFIWSGSGGVALSQVVMDLGWSVGLATSKRSKPVDIKASLSAMSDEERAALFAEFGVSTTKKSK